jgi:hypothetical protein
MMRAFFGIVSVIVARTSCFFISVGVLLYAAGPVLAQPERSKTSSYVKVRGVANKPNDTGRQIVTVTLEIDENYILIGDKVPEDLATLQFQVKFIINGKPAEAEILYPRGKVEKDKVFGDYTIYEGKVACTGTVRRAAGDTSPIEVVVTMQGYPQRRTY